MRRAGALLGATAALAVALLFPASGGAVTVGAPLNLPVNSGVSCQGLVLIGVPPSCTLFGSDTGGSSSQTPRGSWRITRARVRTGPNVGPMVFTVMRALRSQAGSPPAGIICCTVPFESPVFTPAPNTVNELAVNLPVVNTVEVIDGEPIEVVDYLGISMLNLNSMLPVHVAASSTPSFSYFIPAVRAGQQALQAGGLFESTVLVNGEYEPAATTTPAPGTLTPPVLTPPPVSPFRLLPRARLLPGGTRARLGVEAPGAGLLRAFAPLLGGARVSAASPDAASSARRKGRAKGKRRKPSLLVPAKRRIKQPGKAYITVKLSRVGKARLNKRGKLTVPVRVVFKPTAGATIRRTKPVTFRKLAKKAGKGRTSAR